MKPEKIQDALNLLDDDLLESVNNLRMQREKKKQRQIRMGLTAAGICAVFGLTVLAMPILKGGDSTDKTFHKSETVDVEPENQGPADENPGNEDRFEGAIGNTARTDAAEQNSTGYVRFTAVILECPTEQVLLVRPAEGEVELNCSDQIYVSIPDHFPEEERQLLKIGATVEITYDGLIQETYPAQIPGVVNIKPKEEENRQE